MRQRSRPSIEECATLTAQDTFRVPYDSKLAFGRFVDTCWVKPASFSLTPGSDLSPYALCFGIYALHLIRRQAELAEYRGALAHSLRKNLKQARLAMDGNQEAKAFRQLLTLSLSALTILGDLEADPLANLVQEQLPEDLEGALGRTGALEGRPQSGNQAMFLAIFLLHAQFYLGRSSQSELELWLRLHRESMNRFGFWGPNAGPTHLHIQNGYHQYEIFEYLGAENLKSAAAIRAASSLADPDGHHAPYPGGGGCFDYDAVFVLTPDGHAADIPAVDTLLRTTANTIATEQQADGGFCESLRIRPRFRGLSGFIQRLGSANNLALLGERARYAITLQRPKHNRIHTHWSQYQRQWGETNLWDSWFRMLTLARIECAFNPACANQWGFIDYPGIGWHPSLRKGDPLR